MGSRLGDVEHRRAIDRNPNLDEVMGDQAADQPGGGLGHAGLEVAPDGPAAG